MTRVVLVSCGKTKGPAAAPARDLYTGELFRKSRDYAEGLIARREADAWFILSAKHGLLDPAKVIAPYDATLSDDMASTWAWGVHLDLMRRVRPCRGPTDGSDLPELVILAGATYAVPLVETLVRPAAPFEPTIPAFRWPHVLPLHGLEIGDRLHWFSEQRRAA